MNFRCRAGMALAFILLAGCASTTNPVFNSSANKPRLYGPQENRGGFGVPAMVVGATGEVRYCRSGLPSLVEARQKEAYAAIAQTCGGEDRYTIRGEMMADATGSLLGVNVQCQGNSGRAIVFACKGGKP